MPLKLLCGASRKITDGNYGSRGANLHFEVELDPMLLADVPEVQERIRQLYEVINQALAEELARDEDSSSAPPAPTQTPNGPSVPPGNMPSNGHRSPNGKAQRTPAGPPRRATPAQLKAIDRIAKEYSVDLRDILYRRYRLEHLEDLSLRDASVLIDALKSGDAETAA